MHAFPNFFTFDAVQQMCDEDRYVRNSYRTTNMKKKADNPKDKHTKQKKSVITKAADNGWKWSAAMTSQWGSYARLHIVWTFVHPGEVISTYQDKNVQICRNSELMDCIYTRLNQAKD